MTPTIHCLSFGLRNAANDFYRRAGFYNVDPDLCDVMDSVKWEAYRISFNDENVIHAIRR